MSQLCFGTFASTIQRSLQENEDWWDKNIAIDVTNTRKSFPTQTIAGQRYTVLRLLTWIISRDDVCDRNGSPIFITDSNASTLMNQTSELNAAIVRRIQVGDLDIEALSEFEQIRNEIIKYKINDLIREMYDLVDKDSEVSEVQREELLSLCKKETLTQFLSNTFLYACCLKNKLRSTDLNSNDGWLIHISHNICPICRKNNLSISYGTSTKRLYENVEFSIEPNSSKKAQILICTTCYRKDKYKIEKDGSEPSTWTNLRNIYNDFLLRQDVEKVFENNNLASQIEDVVKALVEKPADQTLTKDKPETWEAKKVKQKISDDEWLLAEEIKKLADAYYFYIKSVLSDLDNGSNRHFRKICNQVSSCYLEVSEKISNQRQIFYGIRDWIARHAGVPENSQEALVIAAFFVQNCEVFDEISK